MGGMGGDAGEDIGQPGLRVDAIHFAGDDNTVHSCGALSAAIRSAKQPRLSAESNPSQPSLGGIVGQAYAPVLKEQGEARPPLENVIERFEQVVPTGEPGGLLPHIDMKIVDQWPA